MLKPSILLALMMSVTLPVAFSQATDATRSTPIAATAATVIPALVRYQGADAQSSGKSARPVNFLIFKDETGGEPLWTETQTISFDPAGKYEVYLGATYSSGLPSGLFGTGEARWLEVQISGETPAPRTLISSVPYALKAADAATLGGLPASAFALAGTTGVASVQANAITPDAASNVTTTGGTNFYLPRFTGASTVVSSEIYDSGTSVGIGVVPNAGVKLDVGGAMIMRGNMTVSRIGNATASKAYPSYGFDFFSNVYNSSTKAVDNPYFQLQSEPTGNNTASPSATFNLLFANNGSAVAETGFYINPNGTIHFASGQTFPATSLGGITIDGTSSYGIGVQGNSTSGTGVQGVSSSSYGVEGTSTSGPGVLGYTSGSNLNTGGVIGEAGGTSGFGGIAGVWGDASNHVGVLGTSSQYSGVQGISSAGPGVQGVSTSNTGVLGTSTNGVGVQGSSTNNIAGFFSNNSASATVSATNSVSNGGSALSGVAQGSYGIAVFASETGTDGTGVEAFGNGNGVIGDTSGGVLNTAGVLGIAGSRTGVGGIAGVWGDAQEHVGVIGTSTDYAGVFASSTNSYGVQAVATGYSAGVYGVGGSSSTTFSGNFGVGVGVWGDTTGGNGVAVAGTATDDSAGDFSNNSTTPTILAYNYGSGATGDAVEPFRTFEASTSNGTCGFGDKGNLTCTGQVKTLAATSNGARMVETYSMQSPENWMEDFGSGTLQNGVATISLEAGFAETVSGNADYHVFLTPRGDSKGLYVTNTSATSFEVHESGGGTSTLGFDYRIVAKRRGFETQRMVDVTEAMKTVNARKAQRLERYNSARNNSPAK